MTSTKTRRIALAVMLTLLSASQALAGNVFFYTFSPAPAPPAATRLRFNATGKSGACAYGPTNLLGASTTSGWLLTPPPSPASPTYSRMHWNGGAQIGNSYTAVVQVPIPAPCIGSPTPYQCFSYCSWRTAGDAVISNWGVGFQMGSAPVLYNHATDPDGNPNTNMVITNIQMAQTAQAFAPDKFVPTDPAIAAAFAATTDPLRAGPFTVTPGSTMALTPAPTINGDKHTVLVRGRTQLSAGGTVDFLVMIMKAPSDVPMTPPLALAVMGLALFGVGVFYFRRSGVRGLA